LDGSAELLAVPTLGAPLDSSRGWTLLTALGMFRPSTLIPAITRVYGIYLNEIRRVLD